MVLFINACVREQSRTKVLADHLLKKLNEDYEEVKTFELDFPVMDDGFLSRREEAVSEGFFEDPCLKLARQFAAADKIVIAAPYWDLSFPSSLKCYIEQINVTGVTFEYSPEGIPTGLCKAKELYYVTTSGGTILSDEYGFGYVKSLAEDFYQIPKIVQIKAEGLDIDGTDVDAILEEAKKKIDHLWM